MKQGIMISIEGNDGAGKTTAARELLRRLEAMNIPVLLTREPGGSPVAEQIRTVLLEQGNDMDALTESLLYAASRREHLKKTIEPALAEGRVVLCDRFLDSSLAYQGAGRELGMKRVEQINDIALHGFRPDLTLFFRISQEEGRRRMVRRGEMNRLDLEDEAFHARVRGGFEQLAAGNPQRIVVIDAGRDPQTVADQAMEAIQPLLERATHD